MSQQRFKLKFRIITLAACLGLAPVAQAAGKSGEVKPHWVRGVFVGMTETDYDNAATYGFETEYRATKYLGVGGVVEYIPDLGNGQEATLTVLTGHVHPGPNIRGIVGAGRKYNADQEKAVWRLGAAYDVHIDKFHLSPMVQVDFIDTQDPVMVYGVAVARSFY